MYSRDKNLLNETLLFNFFSCSDQLDDQRRNHLFMLLERYRYTIENSAFPMPQGFTSFFTYLGYRSLRYPMFLQYVERSVFELQVDVTKIIMAGTYTPFYVSPSSSPSRGKSAALCHFSVSIFFGQVDNKESKIKYSSITANSLVLL